MPTSPNIVEYDERAQRAVKTEIPAWLVYILESHGYSFDLKDRFWVDAHGNSVDEAVMRAFTINTAASVVRHTAMGRNLTCVVHNHLWSVVETKELEILGEVSCDCPTELRAWLVAAEVFGVGNVTVQAKSYSGELHDISVPQHIVELVSDDSGYTFEFTIENSADPGDLIIGSIKRRLAAANLTHGESVCFSMLSNTKGQRQFRVAVGTGFGLPEYTVEQATLLGAWMKAYVKAEKTGLLKQPGVA